MLEEVSVVEGGPSRPCDGRGPFPQGSRWEKHLAESLSHLHPNGSPWVKFESGLSSLQTGDEHPRHLPAAE